jgi:hypothetical protein
MSSPFASTPTGLSGSLESAVYKTASGTLDFFYQITDTTGKVQDLGVPIGAIGGTVSVFYVLSSSSPTPIPPFKAETNTDGIPSFASNTPGSPGIVDFTLSNMKAGVTSVIFEVQTTDKTYTTGTANISTTVPRVATASTYSPVPEPGFYGLLAIGLAGLFWVATRRSRRPANSTN